MRIATSAVLALLATLALSGTSQATSRVIITEHGPYWTEQSCNDARSQYTDADPCTFRDSIDPKKRWAWYFTGPQQPG